ncbi:E3 ubiquitin-protein ligase TRIM71-like [Oopsacas minuta]|uniref:E3 ubiquitin-protein ligase TRIM71-like n=1 Tax=Oopsacas minuta TaxID=111878 RepID=A0AAV7K448_9METZ|nr:E3 ubiquitin-protein ligase TRIM71-like [Oopsacas minuta]
MAAKDPPNDIFDSLAADIIELFDKLFSQIHARKDALLVELESRKLAFYEKLKTQNSDLQELEKARGQLEKINLEQSKTDLFIQSFESIDKQISMLKTEQSPKLKFDYSITEISSKIQKLGSILELTRQNLYSNVTQATNIFGDSGKKNKSRFTSPQYIFSDRSRLFMLNSDKLRIHFYHGSKKAEIEHEEISPLCVVAHDCYIYVCCKEYPHDYSIRKYNKDTYKCKTTVNQTGGSSKYLEFPCGIALAGYNNILIADCNNNRVCVFDSNLYYKREFGIGELKKPKSIQVSDELVYVLHSNQYYIQVFNLSGEKVDSILPIHRIRLKDPKSFCLDDQCNIIIADYGADTIKIFTPAGEIIHKIGRETPGTEDVSGCFGVVWIEGRLIVSCESLDCIKSFYMI